MKRKNQEIKAKWIKLKENISKNMSERRGKNERKENE